MDAKVKGSILKCVKVMRINLRFIDFPPMSTEAAALRC